MDLTPPLTEAEIHRLDDFLMSDAVGEDSLSIDELHGFLTAMAVAPQQATLSHWLSVVFDGEPRFASMDEANEIIGLIVRMYNQVVDMLLDDQYLFMPLLAFGPTPGSEEMHPIPEGWCYGFLRGVASQEALWEQHAEALWEFLLPIYVFSGMENLPDDLDAALLEGMTEEDLMEVLDFCIRSIDTYWKEVNSSPPVTH